MKLIYLCDVTVLLHPIIQNRFEFIKRVGSCTLSSAPTESSKKQVLNPFEEIHSDSHFILNKI